MKSIKLLLGVALLLSLIVLGCTDNARVKSFGGEATLNLEPHEELKNVTWKSGDLWILIKDHKLDAYVFKEYSSLGIMEGKYIIKDLFSFKKDTITISNSLLEEAELVKKQIELDKILTDLK